MAFMLCDKCGDIPEGHDLFMRTCDKCGGLLVQEDVELDEDLEQEEEAEECEEAEDQSE